MNDVIFREGTETDENFIINSWLFSFQESTFVEDLEKKVYFKFHSRFVKDLLKRPTVKKLIAADAEDPMVIFGYAIFEQTEGRYIFHYIYVKRPFSGFGIAKELIKNAPFPIKKGVYASHITYKGRKLIEKYDLIYCPYLL